MLLGQHQLLPFGQCDKPLLHLRPVAIRVREVVGHEVETGYFWLQFSGEVGKCFPATVVQNITISYAVFAAVTDITFSILPIFVIWNLKMNRKAKVVVGALLALGIMYVAPFLLCAAKSRLIEGQCRLQ
jgi:hypothetical protein